MSHDTVLAALASACPPVPGRPGTGVSLVARFRDERLGIDESVGTLVFFTDWHLIPEDAHDQWPDGRVCRHPIPRLQRLVDEFANLEATEERFTACHIGDFVDIWRTLTEDDSVRRRVDAVASDYGEVMRRLRDDLQTLFIVGNHDGRIREAGSSHLGTLVRNEAVIAGRHDAQRGFAQRLAVMHGHQFDGVELVVPEAVKEFFVRLENRIRAPRPPAGSPPPTSDNPYTKAAAEEGTAEDEFLNASLTPDNLLPLGPGRDRVGRVVEREFRPDENPMNVANPFPQERLPLARSYSMARDRCWVSSTQTERTSLLVVGHTHMPRIVFGRRQDGSIFVLMDCGSWRGSKRLSRGMPGNVLNAQVGVVFDNDLRIYQLTYE